MDPNEMHFSSYRRHLRARNRAQNTIRDYLYRLEQLAKHHDGNDVTELSRTQLDDYFIHMLERQEASSVGIYYRTFRAFYNWATREEIITVSPMAGMKEPKATDKPPPVVSDDDLKALLKACVGSDFEARRDTAIIRLFCEPGSPRVSEMSGIDLEHLDLKHDQVQVHGKGDKVRLVPFGARTGQAIDRYLRVRAKQKRAHLPALLLGAKGTRLTASGIEQMLRRRCRQAGIDPIHPHLLRHTAAHVWFDGGGSAEDAMELFGWSSPGMPRVYGRSARGERARRAARRRSQADRL